MAVRGNEGSHHDRGDYWRSSNDCDEASPIFLDTREAAALLHISSVTLSRWRIEGRGPEYRKFGRRVVYARADLIAWADAQRRQSTSERPAAKTDGSFVIEADRAEPEPAELSDEKSS
jgi:predicted DNA-binding transcriptional regulator AlpA